MNIIKVKKEELIDKLIENRDRHQAVFEKALESYRKLCVEELEAMLSDARAGKHIRRSISLVEPVNQLKDYRRVIAMLNMSQDSIIELSESDFSMYVLDDWGWKAQFTATNSRYT